MRLCCPGGGLEGADGAAMLEFMEEALDSQTPADLAEFMKREKRLYLWWD